MAHFDKFPKTVPVEEISIVVGYLKGGKEHDLRCVAGSAWWIAGYGMSFLEGNEMHSLAEANAALDDSFLCCALEAAASTDEGMRAIPWSLVLPLLLKLAERLLK